MLIYYGINNLILQTIHIMMYIKENLLRYFSSILTKTSPGGAEYLI